MVSGVRIGAGLRLPLPRSSWGPRLSSSPHLAISVKWRLPSTCAPGPRPRDVCSLLPSAWPLCWLLHLHTGPSILPYVALCFPLFSYMPGPWPSDPCLPETAGPSQVQNGRDPCPSLPLGPVCSLTLRSLLCTHTFLWDWRLAFLPPLRPLLFGFFGWPPAFFCPASQVLRPAFYLSLHSNWEISKSVISLKTRMPASHQARPVSWASDTSTRPPSGPSSSARPNWAELYPLHHPLSVLPSLSPICPAGKSGTNQPITLGSLFLSVPSFSATSICSAAKPFRF